MTDDTRTNASTRPSQSLVGWLGRRRQQISETVHDAGDAYALARDWTVTATAGRLGMGGRTYRDPRFDTRDPAQSQSFSDRGAAKAADAEARQPVRLADAIDELAQTLGQGVLAERADPEAGA
jgi:hypothetical protein